MFSHFRTGCITFFAIFIEVHEFVQNSVFSQRSAGFVIFALCTPLISDFQQGAPILYKTAFSALDLYVLSFSLWAHHFLAFLVKCMSLYKKAFSAGDEHVLTFSHSGDHFLAIFSKGHQFVQNSVFSPRSARFLIFKLGEPLLSDI